MHGVPRESEGIPRAVEPFVMLLDQRGEGRQGSRREQLPPITGVLHHELPLGERQAGRGLQHAARQFELAEVV